ncbi:MAG: hypothetical protein M3279_02400 [Actinomycetota bacterium]|nr:hypothetical protein [Actinomycetota bacterium]
MRRLVLSLSSIACLLALWPAPAAMATHNPCDPAGPVCIRVACPSSSATGHGWIWIDHHGFPGADFSHCVRPD